MKFIKTIIIACVAFAAVSVQAQNIKGFSGYATPGTALNTGTNYAIIAPDSSNGGEPLVTYLNLSAPVGAATLTAYVSTNQTTEAAGQTNSTVTLVVVSTNGFTAGQYVVIQHLQIASARFRNECCQISSVNANGTNLVMVTAPVSPVLPGDIVNSETSWASIPVATSSTAREINGPGIMTGQRNEPFLLVIQPTVAATGTNTINCANATYLPVLLPQ